jgi:A/G-specific adenine glycosylase
MRERNGNDIWKGLYEFPLLEDTAPAKEDESLKKFNKSKIIIDQKSKVFKHVLTHQTIYSQFYILEVKESKYFDKIRKESRCVPYKKTDIKKLPKSVLINKFLNEYIFT